MNYDGATKRAALTCCRWTDKTDIVFLARSFWIVQYTKTMRLSMDRLCYMHVGRGAGASQQIYEYMRNKDTFGGNASSNKRNNIII